LEKTITAYARRTPAAFLEIILLNLEKKSMRRGEFPYRREMGGEGSLVIEVGLIEFGGGGSSSRSSLVEAEKSDV
jgi:hypothetical protein